MFATPAYAQGAADAGAAPGGIAGIFMSVAPLLLIFVIFYFLLIRPQQKRMRQHQTMLGAVKRGDTVITSGGLIGKVTKVDETELEVELAANVRVRVVKSMISDVRQPGAKPAND
jgi:preprotein translocase subunit YajC